MSAAVVEVRKVMSDRTASSVGVKVVRARWARSGEGWLERVR